MERPRGACLDRGLTIESTFSVYLDREASEPGLLDIRLAVMD